MTIRRVAMLFACVFTFTTGDAVAQSLGTILMGLTSITDQGNGLHTRITLTLGDFGGGWIDNGNQSGTLRFNPPDPCPLGPRVTPVEPDPNRAASPSAGPNDDMMRALLAELASMRKRLAELEAKQQ